MINIFGVYQLSPGADYPQPLIGGSGQIYGSPLSQIMRSVCYDQRTYQDSTVEGDEYFSLQLIRELRTLPNVVIDPDHSTALVKIVDDDDGQLQMYAFHLAMTNTSMVFIVCD